MSLPVILRPKAQREFDDAFDWYEEQRPGLGVKFVAAVQKVFDRIGESPEAHAIVQRDVRRAVVAQFPFVVYYRVKLDHVSVIAVIHGKRDHGNWQPRT